MTETCNPELAQAAIVIIAMGIISFYYGRAYEASKPEKPCKHKWDMLSLKTKGCEKCGKLENTNLKKSKPEKPFTCQDCGEEHNWESKPEKPKTTKKR